MWGSPCFGYISLQLKRKLTEVSFKWFWPPPVKKIYPPHILSRSNPYLPTHLRKTKAKFQKQHYSSSVWDISDHPLTRSTLFKFWTLLIAPTLFHNSLMDLTSFEKHFPGRPSLLTLLAFTRSNYFEALVYLCSLVWFICWEPARTSGNHCVRLCGTCRAFPQARDFPSC